MKTILCLATLSTCAAFVPVAQQNGASVTLAATTAELEGLVGVDVETGKKLFDPLGLAQWAPIEYLRKAELSNGRSAMLATVGWTWPATVGMFNSDDVTTTDPIKAIWEADPQWWAQFIVFCGTIEAIKYRGEMDGKSYTGDGDAVIDWSSNWSKLSAAEKDSMRLKELKNGRLAMIGMAGYFADYFIPGSVPGLPH